MCIIVKVINAAWHEPCARAFWVGQFCESLFDMNLLYMKFESGIVVCGPWKRAGCVWRKASLLIMDHWREFFWHGPFYMWRELFVFWPERKFVDMDHERERACKCWMRTEATDCANVNTFTSKHFRLNNFTKKCKSWNKPRYNHPAASWKLMLYVLVDGLVVLLMR